MRFFMGTPSELPGQLIDDIARYRHRVFIEKLGWQLKCDHGLEYDQFDRDDTVYVVAQNEKGDIIGTARLLPTSRPYLLGEVFPQLMNGQKPPCSSDIWELSRFAAVDFDAKSTSAMGGFSSEIAIELIKHSIHSAALLGAKRIITVSPLGVERLLRNVGIQASRAGMPIDYDGQKIFANWIQIPEHLRLQTEEMEAFV